ncbi:MAG: hypothetical protein HW421_1650 [Ignavibacteria bacterium]|nr:hypothetical protein [Ignavibacteria bacterium]
MDYFTIHLFIGIIAGVMAGMFGIGGGVVIVPALIIFSGFSLIQANGTSLAALLLPVAIFAVISYYKAGLINLKYSFWLALGLAIGVLFGSLFALSAPISLLKLFYGIFLLYISWSFMQPIELWRKYILRNVNPSKKVIHKENLNFPGYLMVLVGITAGVLSGMFGIGGGLVIVPVLTAILHFDTKKAIGTSLGALLLPVGLPGVILYHNAGQLSPSHAVPVAIGLLIGSIVGAKITIAIPTLTVKRLYSVFLLIMGLNFIFRS